MFSTMTKDQMKALVREIRTAANELPDGKRRDVNNKLDRIELSFKKANLFNEGEPAPSKSEQVDESIVFQKQRQIVYNWMMAGNTITSLQAFKMFGITRLSAVIFDIGAMTGKAPERKRITVKNRNGRNVSVCEYWIQAEN